MRKVIYHVATTVDGFIARADHSVEGFVSAGAVVDDYLAALRSDYDTALMGRRTYEFGLQFGVTSPYPWMQQYVFSRTLPESPDPAVQLVAGDAAAHVRALKAQPGQAIYLCGGGTLATALLAAGLVDELIVKQNPLLFGAGVPLFAAPIAPHSLELLSAKPYPSGVVLLHYRVR